MLTEVTIRGADLVTDQAQDLPDNLVFLQLDVVLESELAPVAFDRQSLSTWSMTDWEGHLGYTFSFGHFPLKAYWVV